MTQNLVKKVKVAVYGSLRKGLHNHGLFGDSPLLGQYETEPEYTLISLGSFPGLLKGGNTSIVMEVYEVTAEKLKQLDGLEGYHGVGEPNHYNRERIDSPFGELYTYFYNAKNDLVRANAIDTGDWVDYIRTKQIRSAFAL